MPVSRDPGSAKANAGAFEELQTQAFAMMMKANQTPA